MDMKEIMEKYQLTEEEMKEFLDLTKNIDHKEDHKRAYRTMMNQTRRELLKFIGITVKTFEELQDNFKEVSDTLHYHLSMLEQLFYIVNTKSGWKATPRCIGFLDNAIMEEYNFSIRELKKSNIDNLIALQCKRDFNSPFFRKKCLIF